MTDGSNFNASYDDAIAWLMARAGQRMMIEVGQTDPQFDSEQGHADALYMILHDVELGEILHGEELTYRRGAAVFPLTSVSGRSQVILDVARFKGAIIREPLILKVYLHDIYLLFGGATPD